MPSSVEGGLEFDFYYTTYSILKSVNNGIGEYGVKQLV